MDDLFKDSRLRITRAKFHTEDFKGKSAEFVTNNPYKDVIEPNTEGPGRFLKLKMTAPVPAILSIIVAEIFWHLRSALDSAGYAVAKASGIADPGNAHFPFGDEGTEAAYARGKGRSRDLPKEIFTLMRQFKPYKGGNDLLWALNEVCNTSKHEILAATPLGFGKAFITHMEAKGGPALLLPTPVWNSGKNELLIVFLGAGAELDYDMTFFTDITFDDVPVVGGHPTLAVLNQLTRAIDGTMEAIELRTRELGIIT